MAKYVNNLALFINCETLLYNGTLVFA